MIYVHLLNFGLVAGGILARYWMMEDGNKQNKDLSKRKYIAKFVVKENSFTKYGDSALGKRSLHIHI